MTGQEARDDERETLSADESPEVAALYGLINSHYFPSASIPKTHCACGEEVEDSMPEHKARVILAAGYRKHPEPKITERVAGVVKVARDSGDWFTASADAVLARLKTESTEDVMLYHDAVSVLVFARDLVRLVARVPVGEGEQ